MPLPKKKVCSPKPKAKPRAKAKAKAKPKAKAKSAKDQASGREVQHGKPTAKLCCGNDAITANQARDLLGWEVETEQVKFGNNYFIKDSAGTKIRCYNNVTNRPIYSQVYLTLKQEHLRKRWRLNGEPIIVGCTGLILNGQHQLVSLILAAQEWKDHRDRWSDWPQEPTMEKVVIFGVPETDDVVNTMDTCKPRSLSDVLYRSQFFANTTAGDRRKLSRVCDYAIRLLWHRTGANTNAFAPRRTHAESLDFLTQHPKLLECVKHIHEEDDGPSRKITKYISPGYASGLLYLMGCNTTDPAQYIVADSTNEQNLDWAQWNGACDFWVMLASGADELRPVRTALGKILDDGGGSVAERCALIVKAWMLYATNKPVTDELITLTYHIDGDDVRTLAECPTVGGIDIGNSAEADELQIQAVDPSKDEIKQRSAKVRKQLGGNRKGKRRGKKWAKGDTAWVVEEDDGTEPYFATLDCDPYETVSGLEVTVVDADDATWAVSLDRLHLARPKSM